MKTHEIAAINQQFLNVVTTINEKDPAKTLCAIVVHCSKVNDGDDDTVHSTGMIRGPPEVLAVEVIKMVDHLVEQDPKLGFLFTAAVMVRMGILNPSEPADAVTEFINRMKK